MTVMMNVDAVQFICGSTKRVILDWTSTKPYCVVLRYVAAT